jgi:bacteriocin-like protein
MTNEEKVEKIKGLIEEVNELSSELSDEELKAVSGGRFFTPHAPEHITEQIKYRQETDKPPDGGPLR